MKFHRFRLLCLCSLFATASGSAFGAKTHVVKPGSDLSALIDSVSERTIFMLEPGVYDPIELEDLTFDPGAFAHIKGSP